MFKRRGILTTGPALLLATLFAGFAAAHHGWRWAEDQEFELTGVIKVAELGNPHGVLTLDVGGKTWLAEVGQPWRNARAGLKDDMLKPGTTVTIQGHRSSDPDELRMKAERVIIDGKMHDLYPGRD